MKITWLGHSCFKIEGNRTSVITDPYSPTLGYSLGEPAANIVTISHQHPCHAFIQGIGGSPRQITGPGEYEISDVFIVGVGTYHDDERGKKRGKNTVFVIQVGDVLVCHLGDLGHVLTGEQVEEIDNVDVLLLPVGGITTITAPQAAQVVRQLEPKIVVPMHFRTSAPIDSQLEPVDRFLREVGIKELAPQPALSVTRDSLPGTTQIVLLDYPH